VRWLTKKQDYSATVTWRSRSGCPGGGGVANLERVAIQLDQLNTFVSTERNRLLEVLPRAVYEALLPHLEPVRLEQGLTLAEPDEPLSYAYFPRGAVLSMLVPMENGEALEAATIGFEGMFGLPLFLADGVGADEVICQIAGDAARITASAFREAIADSAELTDLLHRYTLALMGQMARTAGCNRAHPVEERCARWLLLTHDRVGRDEFYLTHEFLAAMLGTRRPSVTLIAGQLQQAGLIHYRRGNLTIVDREGLEEVACEDYRLTCDLYERLYLSRARRDRLDGHLDGHGRP
jgi:CRP-like cAMP-binding protein